MLNYKRIRDILEDPSPQVTEALAREAQGLTRQYFGRTIILYAPLYLSNFCSSECTYCGFRSKNRIKRFKLTKEDMHQEMSYLADQRIENILMLTGESYKATPLSYLIEAVNVAKNYFPNITLEVHPMDVGDYGQLFESGVDGITVYQETYDLKKYHEVHQSGIKADYQFRLEAPERAAKGGIRNISMGILLGLSDDIAQDLVDLFEHLRYMEHTYPGVEFNLSFPRLREIKGEKFSQGAVDDITFIKILSLARIYFPRVGINLSTREDPALRDHALKIGVTHMSAGSNTSVGGYTLVEDQQQDPQFDIEDNRSVAEVMTMLKDQGYDPVLTSWRRVENELNNEVMSNG